MKQWAQVMRKWCLWLLGDQPLPGKGTRAMLAGTLAVVVVLIAGGLALMPKSTPPKLKAHRAKHSLTLPTLATPTTTTTVAGGSTGKASTKTTPKSAAARARDARRARARARHSGTGAKPRRSPGATATTAPASGVAAPSSTPSSSGRVAFSAPVVGPAASDAAAAAAAGTPVPGGTVAGPASPAPTARRAPPLRPFATNASTAAGDSLVTWKERDRARVTGYDVFVGAAPGEEWPTPVNGTTLVTGTSYPVTGLTTGQTYYFTVQAVGPGGPSPVSNEVSATPVNAYVPLGTLPGPVVSIAATADGNGYWVVTSSGTVSAHGSAQDFGSAAALDLAAPIVQIVPTPDGKGYWLVAADGGVFAYGDAAFLGSLVGTPASSATVPLAGLVTLPGASTAGTSGAAPTPTSAGTQLVGIAADPATGGYWVVTAGGTVTGFGAPNLGPQTGTFPVDTVVGITASPDGKGYWEVTRSGGVYAYGAAPFHGSVGELPLNTPVSGMAVDSTSGGYWLVGLDGGIFAFDAPFEGAG